MSSSFTLVTAGKLLTGDIFGVEKYLTWGAQVHDVTLTNTGQRRDAIDALDQFAKSCRMRSSLRERLVILADELLMNAIFDAPVEQTGAPKYVDTPRGTVFELEPSESVQMRYASDGNHLALSVTDRFGRLRRETACRYMVRCFSDNENAIRQHGEGAGLGLYMAYQAISSLVINCDPGRRTEVIGLMNIHSKPTEDRAFHYFLKPEF